jgi:hypothetical protein
MPEPEAVDEHAAELTPLERQPQPDEPLKVTMRYANSLLEESRFEEALQAFLELSRKI